MNTYDRILGEIRTYGDRANTHAHAFAQLILPLQGLLFIQTDAYDLKLEESRLFFLPPQCQHTFYAHQRNEFLVLDVPHFWLTEPVKKISRRLESSTRRAMASYPFINVIGNQLFFARESKSYRFISLRSEYFTTRPRSPVYPIHSR